MSKPILSAFADEYKKDFDGQLEGLNGFGINYMELRFVNGTNVAMLTPDEVKAGGMDKYFTDHTLGIFPASAEGVPFNTGGIGIKGDPVADLNEDLAAEQKARVTYDNILRLSDDPDVNDVIKFLRQREIVHYQRFGEALRRVTEGLDQRNYYAFNPSYTCKKR